MRTPRYGDLQAGDPFFSPEDYAVFELEKSASSVYDGQRQRVRDKLLVLHDVLYPEIKRRGWDLHPHWHPPNIVSTWFIGRIQTIQFMKLRYLRSKDEVRKVEQMMGLPRPLDRAETQYTKHPMVDVRIDNQYLAIELLLTDQAWWDAQNFKRKVEQHERERTEFISLLRTMGDDYIFGGWPDSKEPELVTKAPDLANEDKLLDWLARFRPGYNWLRLGSWYRDCNDGRLSTERIAEEIIMRFGELYPVYEFLLWRPDNDFR
ncbi:MAG: hypothetical protein ACOC6F_03365 [bacterium]